MVEGPFREDPFLGEGRVAHLVVPSFREVVEREDVLRMRCDEGFVYGWYDRVVDSPKGGAPGGPPKDIGGPPPKGGPDDAKC